jgi:hypothetical protein
MLQVWQLALAAIQNKDGLRQEFFVLHGVAPSEVDPFFGELLEQIRLDDRTKTIFCWFWDAYRASRIFPSWVDLKNQFDLSREQAKFLMDYFMVTLRLWHRKSYRYVPGSKTRMFQSCQVLNP